MEKLTDAQKSKILRRANQADNLQLMPQRFNSSKGATTMDEWAEVAQRNQKSVAAKVDETYRKNLGVRQERMRGILQEMVNNLLKTQ